MGPAAEVRALVGTLVDVETHAGTVHGVLLSCTGQSLWLVDGDDDLVVPMTMVRSVHRPTAA